MIDQQQAEIKIMNDQQKKIINKEHQILNAQELMLKELLEEDTK